MEPVPPVVVRWLVSVAGSVVIAMASAVMALEHVSWKTICLAAATALGSALLGSLKTLPDTIRLSGVPGDIADFIKSLARNSQEPPLPGVTTTTPATPVLSDVEQ